MNVERKWNREVNKMTVIRKPTVIKRQGDENVLTLYLQVDAEIEDFKGHFPQFALLPGVTQIDWAVHLCLSNSGFSKILSINGSNQIPRAYFKRHTSKLTLTWHADKQKLHFSYTSGQDDEVRTHSSGRNLIRLKEACLNMASFSPCFVIPCYNHRLDHGKRYRLFAAFWLSNLDSG